MGQRYRLVLSSKGSRHGAQPNSSIIVLTQQRQSAKVASSRQKVQTNKSEVGGSIPLLGANDGPSGAGRCYKATDLYYLVEIAPDYFRLRSQVSGVKFVRTMVCSQVAQWQSAEILS